jgi:serine/threonine protein kinase
MQRSSASDRAAFLREACAGEEALRQEVESLLRYAHAGDQFLERPALEEVARLVTNASESMVDFQGRRLGVYQIEARIGAGAMGDVYRARDTKLGRDVAIKVAVAANEGEGTRVFKIPLDGGPPVRLRHTLSFNPVWSPDGRFIVYAEQYASGNFDVKTMTPDGAPVVVPAMASLGSRFPLAFGTPYRFMPDGNALVTLQGTAPNQNFFRLDLETGEQRQLTNFDLKSGSVIQNFDISPDGKRIVFDRLRKQAFRQAVYGPRNHVQAIREVDHPGGQADR